MTGVSGPTRRANERSAATPLSARERLAFLIAPLTLTLVCAVPGLVMRDWFASFSLAFSYFLLMEMLPTYAIGLRLYRLMPPRWRHGIALCIGGGALLKAGVLVVACLITPPVSCLFGAPLRSLLAKWLEMWTVYAPVAAPCTGLGALEGLFFWLILRFWPTLRSETVGE